jgi:hypothetical protein
MRPGICSATLNPSGERYDQILTIGSGVPISQDSEGYQQRHSSEGAINRQNYCGISFTVACSRPKTPAPSTVSMELERDPRLRAPILMLCAGTPTTIPLVALKAPTHPRVAHSNRPSNTLTLLSRRAAHRVHRLHPDSWQGRPTAYDEN